MTTPGGLPARPSGHKCRSGIRTTTEMPSGKYRGAVETCGRDGQAGEGTHAIRTHVQVLPSWRSSGDELPDLAGNIQLAEVTIGSARSSHGIAGLLEDPRMHRQARPVRRLLHGGVTVLTTVPINPPRWGMPICRRWLRCLRQTGRRLRRPAP
jgi:hypothetical protein